MKRRQVRVFSFAGPLVSYSRDCRRGTLFLREGCGSTLKRALRALAEYDRRLFVRRHEGRP